MTRPTRDKPRRDKRETLLIARGPLLNFWLSPFWLPHPLTDELYCYPGVEWRFQAYKALFVGGLRKSERVALHDMIASSGRARAAADMGRSVANLNVVRWNHYAYNVMLLANLAKFTQHDASKRALLATGDKILVEHRPDKKWGDGKDGSGENLQGKILEAVRGVIK
jgi:ribA/ribD-fused uncharacterized protein